MRILLFDPMQLNQDDDEHDEVEDEDDTEIGHNGNVEGNVVFQPAAAKTKKDEEPLG